MARTDPAVVDYAKKLLRLSLDGDDLSEERVLAVLETLRRKPPPRHRSILQAYLHEIRRQLKKSQAIIEYAGEPTTEQIEAIVQSLCGKYHRTVTPVPRENRELIAGIRVFIADDVYDLSVAGRLAALARAVH